MNKRVTAEKDGRENKTKTGDFPLSLFLNEEEEEESMRKKRDQESSLVFSTSLLTLHGPFLRAFFCGGHVDDYLLMVFLKSECGWRSE